MIKKYNFSELDNDLLDQSNSIFRSAFPDVIFQSEVVQHAWKKILKYFPTFQLYYVESNSVVGFINAIPFFWDKNLKDLPDEGWDWLVETGIRGYEQNITPNSLGGLQIIVAKNYLGKGYSKLLIKEGKKLANHLGYKNFVIPIRPTLKSNFPKMHMEEYMELKKEGKIYDPWIRTHISSGAHIIKICPKAMSIYGSIQVWESLLKTKIQKSGDYIVEGALNPVSIDLNTNSGAYYEDNIWINYNLDSSM
ncbi:MAG: hypothetical protein P1U56_10600 [Saprospiraceae bacterium]|nr:hypothetical protein [Saprospiraceae bacterium]